MVLIPLALAALATPQKSNTFTLEPISKGAMSMIGYYAPQRLSLSETKPDSVKALPTLTSPVFGELPMAGKKYVVVVDQAAGKFYVDANGDGDLTNDPTPEWKPAKYKGNDGADLTRYMGSALIDVTVGGKPTQFSLGMYIFDANDTGRAQLKNVLLYYRDYAAKGTLKLGKHSYPFMLSDESATGQYEIGTPEKSSVSLLIDRDGDGKYTAPAESFNPAKPFKIDGQTYEVSSLASDGSSISLKKSKAVVEEIPLPPNLSLGKKALEFEAETTSGQKVQFPKSYKGKVVMLDFWATWCGPCVAELPNVKKAYEQFGGKGFEILSISLDQKGDGEKLAKFTKDNNMPWSQVYDGGFWDARVAKMYGVRAIPFVILVDGDTGKVIADQSTLRGPGLSAVIEKFVKEKGK